MDKRNLPNKLSLNNNNNLPRIPFEPWGGRKRRDINYEKIYDVTIKSINIIGIYSVFSVLMFINLYLCTILYTNILIYCNCKTGRSHFPPKTRYRFPPLYIFLL